MPVMADTRLGAELVAAQRLTLSRLQAETRRRALAIWDAMGSYDRPDIERFLALVVPLIEGAATIATASADGYIASYIQAELALPTRPLGLRPTLRSVPVASVYERPFLRAWSMLSAGTPYVDAVRQGRDYLDVLSATDVQLAFRNATSEAMVGHPQVRGYRRVLGPHKNCGLCVVASTQRYKRETLSPIHGRCGCTVEPILDGPAGQVIDRDRLKLVKEQLRSEQLPYTRSAMSRLRIDPTALPDVTIQTHRELGPVLTVTGQHYDAA